jgi:PIN domain nuclease of toxin-antitoxin system
LITASCGCDLYLRHSSGPVRYSGGIYQKALAYPTNLLLTGVVSRNMSNKIVLDASALLCLLNDEPGTDEVAKVLTRSIIGAVNLGEVVSKLRERGLQLDEVQEALGGLHLDVRPLSASQAMRIGDLRPITRSLGLSLGDRACLALALDLNAEIYTTDAALARAEVEIGITNVRA